MFLKKIKIMKRKEGNKESHYVMTPMEMHDVRLDKL